MLLLQLSTLLQLAFAGPVVKRAGVGIVTSQQYTDLVRFTKYCGATLASTCPKPNGNIFVSTFQEQTTDTYGYVARDPERLEIVIAFRGTASVPNFVTDASVTLVQCSSSGVKYPTGALCHTGFQNAYNAVASQVISIVRAQLTQFPKYTIRVTGHSLGGALASLAAVSMQQNFPSNLVFAYTLGQPRTGDYNYAQFVDTLFPFRLGKPTFMRAIHTNDGVPGMPRAGSDGSTISSGLGTVLPNNNLNAKSGYRHHGTEFWQTPDPASRQTTVQCQGQEDPTCAVSIAPTNVAPAFGINLAHLTYFNTYLADPSTAQQKFCT